MKKKRCLKGAVTVEASLVLPIFLFGYVLILSLVQIIRTESIIQHSVNRMAAELSEYCYIADKLSLTDEIQKSNISISEAVENITELTGSLEDQESEEDGEDSVIVTLTKFLLGDTADMGMNGPAIEAVCHVLMPKYIAENRNMADKYLEKLGGVHISDIDFRYSSLLKDGKSVKLVAIYNVKLDSLGFFDGKGITLTMKNTASSAAWLSGKTKKEIVEEEEKSEEEKTDEETKWDLPNATRGKAWVKEIKTESADKAVKSGVGIDIYDSEKGVFTQIFSVNVFTVTYSDYDSSKTGATAYTLNEKAFEQKLKTCNRELETNLKKIGTSIQMEDETTKTILTKDRKKKILIVVPAEAEENTDMYNSIMKISKKVSEDKKTEVEIIFREKAL